MSKGFSILIAIAGVIGCIVYGLLNAPKEFWEFLGAVGS